jgi:glycosyltransferase involved in cell wall biosynthesis
MNRKNINILFVTSHCPHKPAYGAQHRVLNIGRLLSQMGRVSFVIATNEDIDMNSLKKTRDEFDLKRIVRLKPNPLKNGVERMRFELDPMYMNTNYSMANEPDRQMMLRMIREYDVIWVHTTRTANDFQIFRWPRTILDVDDLQSRVYHSKARTGTGLIRRILDYRMSHIWRRREYVLKDRFGVIAVCSEDDRKSLGDPARTFVIPNGFAIPSRTPRRIPARPPRLGFIGLFQYLPNRTGVEWFINKVWPLIKRDAHNTRLRLIGQDSNKDFPTMGPDIDGLGYLDDPSDEISTWSAMIVPVRFGGGTRVKIAEAFSRKCPVVSTTLGAHGYNIRNGEELLLADNEVDFGKACIRLMTDQIFSEKITTNAWNRFKQELTWDSIGDSVFKAIQVAANGS